MWKQFLESAKKLSNSRFLSGSLMVFIAIFINYMVFMSMDRLETSKQLPAENANLPSIIQIQADGITIKVELFEGTVADAIEKSGIVFGEGDECTADLEMPISDGLNIQIKRIRYVTEKKSKVIPYETIYRTTNELASGETKQIQKGKNGSSDLYYVSRYVDGKLEGKVNSKNVTTTEPVNEILLVGKLGQKALSPVPFSIDLDKNGQPVKYKKKYTGVCSAYTSDNGSSGKRTATGERARVGLVAVDPSIFPYGTKMYVVSPDGSMVYGYAVSSDTGGAMTAGKAAVDLYMNTYEECIQFGRRTMNIYVLE